MNWKGLTAWVIGPDRMKRYNMQCYFEIIKHSGKRGQDIVDWWETSSFFYTHIYSYKYIYTTPVFEDPIQMKSASKM